MLASKGLATRARTRLRLNPVLIVGEKRQGQNSYCRYCGKHLEIGMEVARIVPLMRKDCRVNRSHWAENCEGRPRIAEVCPLQRAVRYNDTIDVIYTMIF